MGGLNGPLACHAHSQCLQPLKSGHCNPGPHWNINIFTGLGKHFPFGVCLVGRAHPVALDMLESVLMLIQAGSSHTFLLCRAISGIINYLLISSINVSVLTPVTMGPRSYLALGIHKLSPLPEPSEPGWRVAGKDVCGTLDTL